MEKLTKRIEAEIRRAKEVLDRGETTAEEFKIAYGIQQALEWVINEDAANSPINTLLEGKVLDTRVFPFA